MSTQKQKTALEQAIEAIKNISTRIESDTHITISEAVRALEALLKTEDTALGAAYSRGFKDGYDQAQMNEEKYRDRG